MKPGTRELNSPSRAKATREAVERPLSLAEAIAEAHHGSVRVHSAAGDGSRFEMLIPAAPTPKVAAFSSEAKSELTPTPS
jgi:light-regulated signal transduction histidine kinase (bacteriophytochrome)